MDINVQRYNPNYSIIAEGSEFIIHPDDVCTCAHDMDVEYFGFPSSYDLMDDCPHPLRPRANMWNVLIQVEGNPVKMSPNQATYTIHVWNKDIILDANVDHDGYHKAIKMAQSDEDDSVLYCQFSIASTQDDRDIILENRDILNGIPFNYTMGTHKFKSAFPKASYFKRFEEIISCLKKPPAPRELESNPHISSKKKNKKK